MTSESKDILSDEKGSDLERESEDDASTATGSQIDRSETSTSQLGSEDENWEDWEEDGEACLCLFCDQTFPSAKDTLSHCKDVHSFDFVTLKTELGLDFYKTMRLVNFIRQLVKNQPNVNTWKDPSFQSINATHPLFSDDKYLKPILQDDALLYSLNSAEDENADEFLDDTEAVPPMSDSTITTEGANARYLAAEKRARAAEEKVVELEALMKDYQEILKKSLTERSLQTKQVPHSPPQQQLSTIEGQQADNSDFDAYFTGYAHFGIHESMLKDAVRTDSYRDAIYLNKHLIKDKVVLDIGCGTSILSMFSAKAGAKKVIGIDRSDIILKAEKIIRENELDQVVTLVRGKVEEVVLPVEKVDVIVSEWMGYFLLFESMLDTVIFARDKWLKPDGIGFLCRMFGALPRSSFEASNLFYSSTELFAYVTGGRIFGGISQLLFALLLFVLCALVFHSFDLNTYYNDHIDYWKDVYGFKMDCMQEPVLKEAHVDVIHDDEIMSTPHVLKTFDILHMKKEDQEYISPFELKITKEGPCHAFVGYFDTEFTWNANPQNQNKTEEIVKFSTGPHATPTHWRQTVFLLEAPIPDLKVDDVLKGTLTCSKDSQYFRALNILIEYWVEKGGVKVSDVRSQHYLLG